MSGKSSGRQSNLFSYFQKKPKDGLKNEGIQDLEVLERENIYTPPPKLEKGTKGQTSPGLGSQQRKKHSGHNATLVEMSDDDDSRGVGFMSCTSSTTPSLTRTVKRRRVILSSDEEEGEVTEDCRSKAGKQRRNEDGVGEEEGQDANVTPARRGIQHGRSRGKGTEQTPSSRAKTDSVSGPFTPSSAVGTSARSFIDSFNIDADQHEYSPQAKEGRKGKDKGEEMAGDEPIGDERFPHLDFEFLKAGKIKDAKGRRPDHPEYDARTLLVPDQFLKSQTPGHRQWWKLKSEHFDTILFFKVGKFYELFHMDAVIAVENLGLVYMRSKIAHCGFPEIGYGRFADQLVNRGHKVARVEQTETPQQLAERQSKAMSQDREKVVRREICRITTQGTKTFGVQDGTESRELDGTADPNPNFLMALKESTPNSGPVQFGVCFVDCTTGIFKLSQFADDANQSNLRTLLAHNYPAQFLYEKGNLSTATMSLLNTMLSTVPKEALFPKRQFCTADATLLALCNDNYLGPNLTLWPETLRQMLCSPDATAIPTPSDNFKLCLSALGAVNWYLKQCLVDVDTITMRQFQLYVPPSLDAAVGSPVKETIKLDGNTFWKGKHMILDAVSLTNLHIVPSLSSPSPVNSHAAFSLFNTINRCHTAFGKRLLRQWVSAPICDREVLLGRQRAIKWLIDEEINCQTAQLAETLRKVPDLPRLFQRIHTIGLKYRADAGKGHPDSRAQLFESDKYNKRKIRDLVIVLDGLEEVQKLMHLFTRINSEARVKAPPLLVECLSHNCEEMGQDLTFIKNAFDRVSALDKGVILPFAGVDEEFDNACGEVETCKKRLGKYLDSIGRRLKCTPKYFGTGRAAFQIELPESACTSLSHEFQLTSQRKGFKRYTTPDSQKLVEELNRAEAQCASIGSEVTRRVFADLDARKDKWASIAHQIATFDCLLSLASYALHSTRKMCFPEFAFEVDKPFIDIQRGYHPSLADTKSTADFDYIPNSCVMGGPQKSAHTMLLTGPNMGGKSTFMRQVASLAVLAQIGSMVPADSMRLSPIDRIFCRIGANDLLSAGQSTFFVELSEAQTILKQATHHSLVLIDELGRGTSTFDGTAVACAVLKHIARDIRCRCLFSTHYHSLCKFVANEPGIELAHMACMVENANLEDPTMESITFLYTLSEGMCDKSYGFYTAKMAGLDVEIVRRAFQASLLLEQQKNTNMGEQRN